VKLFHAAENKFQKTRKKEGTNEKTRGIMKGNRQNPSLSAKEVLIHG
jgi:hypothetical protein